MCGSPVPAAEDRDAITPAPPRARAPRDGGGEAGAPCVLAAEATCSRSVASRHCAGPRVCLRA